MNLEKRISSFAELGRRIPGLLNNNLFDRTVTANNWFTPSETTRAMKSWTDLLTTENLTLWTNGYPISEPSPLRNILVITAGNIPLVGFHDFLTVLITGNRFIGKLSQRDEVLLTTLAQELINIEPGFAGQIQLQNFNSDPDAVIATGSNNSARYFLTEYGQLPHIIRKNRSSIAVLDGSETKEELDLMAGDILKYYGLGCRSISHIYLPTGYSPENLIEPLGSYKGPDPCEPFTHNLHYQRARLSILNKPAHYTSHAILLENNNLHSPICVIHYSFYNNTATLFEKINTQQSEIQCITGHKSLHPQLIPHGSAQSPQLWDYADNIDTLRFLTQPTPSHP